jgi:ubiquinone/menaquinone biosynthesis C-methylase UbiE
MVKSANVFTIMTLAETSSAPPVAPMPTKHNPNLHDLVWDLLRPHKPGKLLDVPSGPGYFAQQAQKNGFDAIAAEIDESLHVLPGVHYVNANMGEKLPFADNTFDYVVSIEGIEHTENAFRFLRECTRVLKPSGKMFLTTPNVSCLQNRLLFLLTGSHDNPPGPIRSDLPNLFMSHINLIPFQRLEAFFRFSGLEIEQVHPYKLRPVSQALYYLIYPFAKFRYAKAFKKHYANKPNEPLYRKIFQMYQSKEVLCGEYNVVVATKN